MTDFPHPPRIRNLALDLAKDERLVASVYAAIRGFGSVYEIERRAFDEPSFMPKEGFEDRSEFRWAFTALSKMIKRGDIKGLDQLEAKYAHFFRASERAR